MKQLSLVVIGFFLCAPAYAVDPASLVQAAIDYWRDQSSYTEAEMIVHRPDWERRMSLRAWTKGSKLSLVRFTAPAKDAGSGSLTVDEEMWSYSPKINRVIKIPPSMMAQSWMGSDFSYDDLAKSDKIVNEYDHKLLSESVVDGQKIYSIESVPKEDSAIVWGKETLKVRADYIILQHDFFDQDMQPIKRMVAKEIKPLGGKQFATVIRITKVETPDEWTEIIHSQAQFGADLPDSMFTITSLSNPRG